MGHAAQELLAVTNTDSHDLIRHSLSNLNDRVQILEGQAKEQGDKLRSIDRHYKLYQVKIKIFVKNLKQFAEVLRLASPHRREEGYILFFVQIQLVSASQCDTFLCAQN